MKRKRMISIILIVTFSIMLVAAVKMKLFDKFIPESAKDTAYEAGTAAEVKPPANQGSNPYSKGDKVLDDTYLHGMNEDVYAKSSYGEEMNIRVTDSYFTRDVTEYYDMLPEKMEFLDTEEEHMDSNGILIDDYFYLVTHVTITNVGTEKGEFLVPGNFRYVFLKDNMTSVSPPSDEVRYAAKIAGNGSATRKGHLISDAGESYTFALITIVSEENLNKQTGEGRECYLGTTISRITQIPNDGDLVKFIKLDLTEK